MQDIMKGYTMADGTWLDSIIKALQELGGSAYYEDLYKKVVDVRRREGLPLNNTYKASIRGIIESYSSDSEVWNRKKDLFRKLGTGHWGLRSVSHSTVRDVHISLIERFKRAYATGEYSEQEALNRELYKNFQDQFGPTRLQTLSGEDLLNTVFLGTGQKGLCYYIESAPEYRDAFGDIRGGTAAKFGLYKHKDGDWIQGNWKKEENHLSIEQAIEVGTDIRDALIKACEIIEQLIPFSTELAYEQLARDLEKIPEINENMWFRKYFHMIYPEYFPTWYSNNFIDQVVQKCGLKSGHSLYGKIGEIARFAKKCEIPNAIFSKIAVEVLQLEKPSWQKSDVEHEELEEMNYENNTKTPLNQILYGAPGTGKTYNSIIRALEIVTGDRKILPADKNKREAKYSEYLKEFDEYRNQIEFVTFHQSMAYEEFIEGIKPIIKKDVDTTSHQIQYEYADGIFKKIANKAKADQSNKYVLIIDEINRGNISKIFGELITLIEPTKRFGNKEAQKVILPYSHEYFEVPNNLYIIGTMNTSDRSIAAVDIALRRRFEFIPMRPETELVTDVDGIYLNSIFKKLNKKIEILLDEDHMIGHSYLMRCQNIEDVKKAWFEKIMPLMNEYFYGDWERLELVLGKDFVVEIDQGDLPSEFRNYCNEVKYYRFAKISDFSDSTFVDAINKLA